MRQYDKALFDVRCLHQQRLRYRSFDWGTEEMRSLSDELASLLKSKL